MIHSHRPLLIIAVDRDAADAATIAMRNVWDSTFAFVAFLSDLDGAQTPFPVASCTLPRATFKRAVSALQRVDGVELYDLQRTPKSTATRQFLSKQQTFFTLTG